MEPLQTTPPAAEPADEWSDRLTIAKLLILTALLAVAFAIMRVQFPRFSSSALVALSAALASLQMVGLPLAVLRLVRVSRKALAPGEWLWAAGGLTVAAGYCYARLFRGQLLTGDGELGVVIIYLLTATMLAPPVFLCRGVWWRLATVPLIGLYLTYAIAMKIYGWQVYTPVNVVVSEALAYSGVLLLVAIATWRDWRVGVRRNGSHWTGVLVFIASLAMSLATQLLATL